MAADSKQETIHPAAAPSHAAFTLLHQSLDGMFSAKPKHASRLVARPSTHPLNSAQSQPASNGVAEPRKTFREELDDDGPRRFGEEDAGIGFARGGAGGVGGKRGDERLETLRDRLLGKRKGRGDGAAAEGRNGNGNGRARAVEESDEEETGRSGLGRRKRARGRDGEERITAEESHVKALAAEGDDAVASLPTGAAEDFAEEVDDMTKSAALESPGSKPSKSKRKRKRKKGKKAGSDEL
jgi:hypothetical protein